MKPWQLYGTLLATIVFTTSVIATGCSSAGSATKLRGDSILIDQLESSLLENIRRSVDYTIRSTGAFEVSLSGSLFIGEQRDISILADGLFGEMPVNLIYASTGDSVFGSNGSIVFDGISPDSLKNAVVIGLSRMGLLHNLAMLISGSPPDHAEGGAAEWVRFENYGERMLRDSSDLYCSFDIIVNGVRSGTAELWFDPTTHLPRLRRQHVEFSDGVMDVEEVYTWHSDDRIIRDPATLRSE